MKKQVSVSSTKKLVFALLSILSIGSFTASAQDTAVIRIDKAKAKEAYQKNSEGRKATAGTNATNRRTTFKENQPARQQTAQENREERKVAAGDGAVTTQEATSLYQENSTERRANAKNAAPSRNQTVNSNSANRKSQARTGALNRRAAVIRH